ncbi:hypothetical protein FB563_4046 [Streptomyces puniciscabiei]|uniref:Uncharacterized protein n=1 Tax=Streptomyces puniciscabiei TaxID=164348 RepID=A0A542UIU4_9ACTN|nr:hypothetical protein [Streptomyces puniciscabiei]TQK98994.1 hypothetical protein FB563_4046 [Streptomyces puniciscabiei]
MADAQIILAYSRDAGILAMPSGTKYEAAGIALEASGFQRGDAGVYRLQAGDPDASRATVAGLVRSAEAHGVTVTASSRRFIGDAARDIARVLSGQWDTQVELYCHPVWQEDLVPYLWDSGELGRAVQTDRIPYAATLTDAASGTTLLLIERPGHQLHYLVGAFAPEPFGEGYGDPHAPRSIVLPPFPGRAAREITDRYLPAYDRAVHARRITTVVGALDRIRTEHDNWAAMVASGRYSDATPLDIDALGATTAQFLDSAWRDFLTVVDHAPALLDRCRPTATPWPEDTEALTQLADALGKAEAVREELAFGSPLARPERNLRTWPAITTWLTHSEPFLRQARAATPHARSALAVSAPARALPPGWPAPHR